MSIDTATYLDFIKDTVKAEGIKIADKVNKLALEKKSITTDQYLAAARILVNEYLNQ